MAAFITAAFCLVCLEFGFGFVKGQAVVEMSQLTASKVVDRPEPNLQKSFSFATYYSDHMVLQKAPKRAIIWGYALNIGERIIIKMDERGIYKTKVYLDPSCNCGVWKIKLPAESSAGPFTITAISSEKTIQLKDVMFGDVWLCSGQSNMQFTLAQAFNATEEMEDAKNFPDIRLFTVADIPSTFALPDLKGIWQQWSQASPASVHGGTWKYFSAVCWLYGKALYKELGYPIGLIDTSWGGTPVEAWSSPDALEKCGLADEPDEIIFEDMPDSDDSDWEGAMANSNLWNSMVHPLLNMTIYGAIWYQGEANEVKNVHKYNCTFPNMIDDWRIKFYAGTDGETDPLFPFGFVQLAPNSPTGYGPGCPEIRWHQTADYGYVPNQRMKNVFMAVSLDLPDFSSPYGSIHPRDKQDVARRLLLSGMTVAYNKTGLISQGPLPESITEGHMNISLKYNVDIKYLNLVGFEALCPVTNSSLTFWTPIPIISPLPNTIVFWAGVCGEGLSIIGLRYLWWESPCAFKTCTVYTTSEYAIPGPPFILYRGMTGVEGTVHKIDWNSPTAIAA